MNIPHASPMLGMRRPVQFRQLLCGLHTAGSNECLARLFRKLHSSKALATALPLSLILELRKGVGEALQ